MSDYLCGIASGLVIALIVAAVWRAWDDYQRQRYLDWSNGKVDPPVRNPWREEAE